MCVVTGIGISNLYITTSEILSKHFDRYKYLAFSLAILGQFCGMIAWPVVSQELFSSNGYCVEETEAPTNKSIPNE